MKCGFPGDVGPTPLGRLRSTSSHHKPFVVFAVLELVKDWVLRSAQVVLQIGDTGGSCYLFLAFLKNGVLAAENVCGQGHHAGFSVDHVKTKDPPGGFTCRESKEKGGREGKDKSQKEIKLVSMHVYLYIYLDMLGTYAVSTVKW